MLNFRHGAAAAAGLAVSLLLAAPARAMPPIDYTLDGFGVDLKSGSFNLGREVLSIGPEGAPDRMALVLSYNSQESRIGPHGRGWSHSYEIRAVREPEGANMVFSVIAGMSRIRFTKGGSVYVDDRLNGAKLIATTVGSVEHFEYISRDGDILQFRPSNSLNCASTALPCDYHVISWTKPDGERLTFSYPTVSGVTGRLSSVNSSLGWNMSFVYNASNRMISAQAVNLANDFCPDLNGAPHCNLASWPKVTFTYGTGLGQPLATITDSQGRIRRYGYDSVGRMIWTKRPSSVSNERTIAYSASGVVTSQVITGVGTRTYAITGSEGVVTDPTGAQSTVFFGTESQPQWVRDGLSRVTGFTYDDYDRLYMQTNPEGDSIDILRDSRGNIKQIRQRPKPGSGLADIVTRTEWPALCPTGEAASCNKPLWTEDAAGVRTDFTWDAATGAPLTVTSPPDSEGIRGQVRFGYQSLYAFTKTSTGGFQQATKPVQRLIWSATCPNSTTCGAAEEIRTTFDYGPTGTGNNRALRLTRLDPAGLAIASALAYDKSGNVLTLDGPLPGTEDMTWLHYDSERRLLGTILPDPDNGGPLKRPATRILYDIDGFPIASERGTATGTTASALASMAVLLRAETVYDVAGRPVRQSLIASGTIQSLRQISYDAAGRLFCKAERMNPAAFLSPPASACTEGPAGHMGRIASRSASMMPRVSSCDCHQGSARRLFRTWRPSAMMPMARPGPFVMRAAI